MCGKLLKVFGWVAALLLAAACASSPDSPSSVLEPVTETEVPPPEEPAPKPSDKLTAILDELGYEGFGMEYENPATLTLLEKVFSAPEAKSRDIKLVYTGGRLQYDAAQKSVTIGGTTNVKQILNFLKKVPKRKEEPVKPAPNPEVSEPPSSP